MLIDCACAVGYTMDTLFFGWVRSSPVVDMPDDLELPQFELVRWILHDCSSNYTSGMRSRDQTPPPPDLSNKYIFLASVIPAFQLKLISNISI